MPDGRSLADIGVVVVTYESAGFIQACIESLPLGQVGGMVVVDNASTDDTVAVVEQCAPRADIVVLPHNVGFGAGCNVGARRLSSLRYLLFLNPDARISGTSLQSMLDHFEKSPTAALVAPRLYDEGRPIASAGRRSTGWSELQFVLPQRFKKLIADRRFPSDYDLSGPVGYVEGACMLIEAAAFNAAGGFDERYFLFFEELDLSFRLRQLQRSVELVAEADAHHEVGGSRKTVAESGRLFYWTSCVRYLRRWHGALSAMLFCAVALLSWGYEVAARALSVRQFVSASAAMLRGWRR